MNCLIQKAIISSVFIFFTSTAFCEENIQEKLAEQIVEFTIENCYKNIKSVDKIVKIAKQKNWESVPDEFFEINFTENFIKELLFYDGWIVNYKNIEYILVAVKEKPILGSSKSKYNIANNTCNVYEFNTPVDLIEKAFMKHFKGKLFITSEYYSNEEKSVYYGLTNDPTLYISLGVTYDNKGMYNHTFIQFGYIRQVNK